MPRKPAQNSEVSDAPVQAQEAPKQKRAKKVAPVEDAPAVPAEPAKRGRKKATPAPADAPAVPAEPAKRGRKKATPAPADAPAVPVVKAPRVAPTRETVVSDYDTLSSLIEAEIVALKESPQKSKGVRFLKGLNKQVKVQKARCMRVLRQKNKSNVKRNNANSGFLKPVQISQDLSTFTGWDKSEPRSRVDVTKFICNYIKSNHLQNPEDGRVILVDNDPKLKKLLKYDNKNEPLTFFRLQTCLKNHFSPLPAVEEAPEPDVPAEVPVPAPAEVKQRKKKAVA